MHLRGIYMNFEYITDIKTPCHIIELSKIEHNLKNLSQLNKKTDIKFLFAIKSFSNEKVLPLFINWFDGICASGLWEARLGKEFLKKPVHTYSSAYKDTEFNSIHKYSDYVIFNSTNQFCKYISECDLLKKKIGLRINPEYSEVNKYSNNPCHQFSRFGITIDSLINSNIQNITGLHFHSMCEQYSDVLKSTLDIVDKKFEAYLKPMRWINIGGGQLYTEENYDMDIATESVNNFQRKYDVKIFAEPGETVLANAGYIVASVLDIVSNGMNSAILDLSAICHIPDIVNSPYRCEILNASTPYTKKYTYRLAGCTCYAGDIFGDYSFDNPLEIGSKIVFLDTAAYSMVKNNYFNGIKPPSCAICLPNGDIDVVKDYDYNTFLSIL